LDEEPAKRVRTVFEPLRDLGLSEMDQLRDLIERQVETGLAPSEQAFGHALNGRIFRCAQCPVDAKAHAPKRLDRAGFVTPNCEANWSMFPGPEICHGFASEAVIVDHHCS
jgi:hypothetical protein